MVSQPNAAGALEGQHARHGDGRLVPGTEIMEEVAITASGQPTRSVTLLVPRPSSDPSDPLNWSSLRKGKLILLPTSQEQSLTVRPGLAIATMALYTFTTTTCALSMSPMFGLFAETFHLTETQVPLITGVTVIVLGFTNFIVIPFSNIFGRRATSLVFGVLFLATSIWQALAKSYGSFMAARAIIGLAAAPSETLMVQVIADLFFIQQRGMMTSFYFTSLIMGATIGPVISGNIAERHGWRSFFWLFTGIVAFNLFLILAVFPETKFHREPQQQTDVVLVAPSAKGENAINPDKEVMPSEHAESLDPVESPRKGRPNSKQYRLIQPPSRQWKEFLLRDFVMPVRVAFFPIIMFAALNFAGPANLLLYWNLSESDLATPPYNFSESAIGYSNFAFAIGAIMGMVLAGPLSEWVCRRATARNGGVREAEMRLPAIVPFLILTVIGTVVGGLALERGWSWPVLLVFGFGITGLCVTSVPGIVVAYAVDSYKPLSGEIMIVGTVLKNTTGFAMTYWMPPMVIRDGPLTPLMVWFTFTVGPMLLAIPMYIWGKRLRMATRNSKVHLLESMI